MTWMAIILCILLLYTLSQGMTSAPWLIGLFLIPFYMQRRFDKVCRSKIVQGALRSEVLFIFLYQAGIIGFRDLSTGYGHWNTGVAPFAQPL